jgi:hypothetical protein
VQAIISLLAGVVSIGSHDAGAPASCLGAALQAALQTTCRTARRSVDKGSRGAYIRADLGSGCGAPIIARAPRSSFALWRPRNGGAQDRKMG